MSEKGPLTEGEIEELKRLSKEGGNIGKIGRAWLRLIENAPEPSDGCVYVAEAEPGVIKIGKSKRPKDRLKTLSTGSPYDLTLLTKKEVPNSRKKETKIQQKFDGYRMRGEWFEVPDDVKHKIIKEVDAL